MFLCSFLSSILFIFGPSCGGKSTLSKALIKELGPTWTYLDRDTLVDETANQMIESVIPFFQEHNQNLIIDAQVPWRKAHQENEWYVLVYAPLENLLERDDTRTLRLNRPQKRAYYAREYVKKTFAEVFEIPAKLGFNYDLVLDSSQSAISNEIEEVLKLINTTGEKLCF